MRYIIIIACTFIVCSPIFAQSNSSSYKRLWELIGKQEFRQAEKMIAGGKIDRENAHDAYITGLYLKSYLQNADEATDFMDAFYSKTNNADPYVYALWFTSPVAGKYGKKTHPHQVALLRALIENPETFGTLRAAAHYQLGLHYLFQNKFDSAKAEHRHVGGLQNWQYVGPFENLSHSGIYKNYGPLEKPDGNSEFLSLTKAKIKWFTPLHENVDGWIPLSNQIEPSTAVAYAQTFVTSPANQEIFCNVGATGAVRVWINDSMILSEPTERVTELDTYTVKCRLQKGVNRILVQLSYTDNVYPNFAIRFTDEAFQPIRELTGSNVFKPYSKTPQTPTVIAHFAEEFFKKKVENEPANMVNYLLLADVYLRNEKTTEARNLIESALRLSGNNLLRAKLIEILQKEENRTVMLEEIDKIRRNDPKASMILEIDINNSTNSERYTEALELLAEYEKLYGEDLKTLQMKIGILGKQEKVSEIVSVTEYAFSKYPNEENLIPVMFIIQREVYRNKEAAMRVYEDFLAENYDYQVLMKYIKLLHQDGKADMVAAKRKWLIDNFPHETTLVVSLAEYHIVAKEYAQAEENLKIALALSPYHPKPWELLGDVKREQNKKDEASHAYRQSLQFDPNQYQVIAKLRSVTGKPEIYKIIPQLNIDQIIAKDVPPDAALSSDQGYYIIEDDRSLVMHPGGALEDYNTYIVRITNEKGIEEFKESHINYASNQNLFIEQYELIKKSGGRLRGERRDNQIVFTNLEVGDVIVYRYRYQNYYSGRFADDFWGKHFFQDEAYIAHSRYSLLLPSHRKLTYVTTNADVKPSIKQVEDFTQYTWEVTRQTPYTEETYMPAVVDVLPALHVSTVNSWNDIATWYADLINKSADETFELKSAFESIFSGNDVQSLTGFEKARRIYTYIQKNIRYSSVSFRQGAYLPQTASKTLTTRLGDCKDLSNLFMKLCDMAGIQVCMVLTDTRENGEKDMMLPSLEFNHCIAKATLDGKEFFVELTDNYLPFTSLPNSLNGALILEIPGKAEVTPAGLKKLQTTTRPYDIAKADITMKAVENDLIVEVTRTRYGHLTTNVKADFSKLPYDKQLIKLEDYVGSGSKNITIDTLSFVNLESTDDSLSFSYRYRISDEVAEIANLKTFKLVFPDVVATSNHFTSLTREYPVDYPAYEDADRYETTIRVEIPEGKKFLEPPTNVSLTFGGMTYDLHYELVNPGLLQVSRTFKSNRVRVDVKDYTNLKTFLDSIVKAEQRMIAFQ